ncbi:hypothetical protein BU17DRAFT_64152 [Hysterangium stoloniferum]|nr:hypothetical protein BU17DRAFT_64152 [Hysterangium stoloniferum]
MLKKTRDACREQEESKSKLKQKSKSMTKVKSKLQDTTDTDFKDMNKVEGNRVQVEGGDPSMKRNEGVLDTNGPMMDWNGNSPGHFDTDMRSASPEILNTALAMDKFLLNQSELGTHAHQSEDFTMEQLAEEDLEELVYDESSPPLMSSGFSSGIHKDRYSGTKITTPSTSNQKVGVRLSQPKFKSNPFSRSSGNLEKQKKDCQTEGTVTAEVIFWFWMIEKTAVEMIPAHCRGTVLGSNERWFQPNPSLLKHKFEVKHRQKK